MRSMLSTRLSTKTFALLLTLCAGTTGCSLLAGVTGTSPLSGLPLGALQQVEMPDVRGLLRDDAEKRVRTAGYTGELDVREKECGAAPAIVCDTMPTSGVPIAQGATVRINVQRRSPDA